MELLAGLFCLAPFIFVLIPLFASTRDRDQELLARFSGALLELPGITRVAPDGDALVATGSIDGLRVTLRCRSTGLPYPLLVRVEPSGTGMPGLLILPVGPGPARPQARPIGDLILDGRVTVEAQSPSSGDRARALSHLRACLDDPRDDLRGLLLDVLQGLDHAEVRNNGVELRTGTDADSLAEVADALPRLAALARALGSEPPAPADDRERAVEAGPSQPRQPAPRPSR